MANNIYHKSNWGSPKKDGWGDVYFNPSATNKLYSRSDNYENSDGTDKALDKKPDTQSILMTPTAYNVGSMNSVLPPYEVLPTELVTNGDFATDSDWSKGTGWSIANGIASCDGTQTGGTQLTQTELTFTKNRTYKVVFTCTVQAGNLDARLQGSGATVTGDTITTSGTYTQYLVSTENTSFRMRGNSAFVGTVDNVSVKEVISADFTFDRSSTATRVNKKGLIETVAIDTPRLDYPLIDGVVQSEPALLLEPARTNLFTYSEDFSQSVWLTWQATKTQSNNINPKGTNGYYEISHTGSSSNNPNTRLVNVSLNGSYTLSFFVKINQSRYISLSIEDYDGDRARVYFDTINKTFTTISNVGSPITNTAYSEFSNGWIRISLSVNLLNAVYNEVGIGVYNPSGSFPSASGEVISVFGAQLEAGSHATSYIPTSGSSVTRSAETCNGAGTSDDFNDSEGVLFAEVAALADDQTRRYIAISDGTVANAVRINYHSDSNSIRIQVRQNNNIEANLTFTVNDVKTFHKVALFYKENDVKGYIDGVKVGTDINATMPTGLNTLEFHQGNQTQIFYGKTKEVGVFKEALTDSELEALTSWTSFNDMAIGQEYTIR